MFTNFIKLFQKAFVRLRSAAMNPFRRVIRRIQQLFNVNLITAKFITPINKKIRQILTLKPKSKEDYVTVGNFWISKKLIRFLILAICAGVFIYFTWFAPAVEDKISTTNVVTTTYFDYDDLDLAKFTGKANIKAANGNVVYTGDIVAGICTGAGRLWNQNGDLVYEGLFENNKYVGIGTLYYPDKKIKYKGEFADNAFSGMGNLYSSEGVLLYSGEFANGAFSGAGIAYDEKGQMIYEGSFENGNYHGEGISYYDTGIKKYEGEFYMGKEQGAGTIYSKTGKRLFTGQFARDDIHFESLLGATLEDILKMFGETPTIYYSESETCFLFENAGIVLKANCLIQLLRNSETSDTSNDWYLPGEDAELLTDDTQETSSVDFTTPTSTTSDNSVELPVLGSDSKYSAYYYLSTDEWQKEGALDKKLITISSVIAYGKDVDVSFLDEEVGVPINGGTELADCVAIDKIRLTKPTDFSNISFEQTTKNKSYIYISGINLAEAIYAEVFEVDGVRYEKCYQINDPEELKYLTLENY